MCPSAPLRLCLSPLPKNLVFSPLTSLPCARSPALCHPPTATEHLNTCLSSMFLLCSVSTQRLTEQFNVAQNILKWSGTDYNFYLCFCHVMLSLSLSPWVNAVGQTINTRRNHRMVDNTEEQLMSVFWRLFWWLCSQFQSRAVIHDLVKVTLDDIFKYLWR